jgi:hypothetical protein
MELEIRMIIHDCDLRKLNKTACLTERTQAYGEGVVSLSTICRGYEAFDSGRTDLNDEPQPGRPQNQSP